MGLISTISNKLPGFIQARGQNLYNEFTNTNQNPVIGGLKAAAEGFGAVTDVANKGLNKIPGVGLVSRGISAGLNKGIDALSNTKAAQNYVKANPQKSGLEQGLEGAKALGGISSALLTAQGVASAGNKIAGLVKPKELTIEQMIEKQYGMQPGSRKLFDDAISNKDPVALQDALTKVPKSYSDPFAKNISDIMAQNKGLTPDSFASNPSDLKLFRGEGATNAGGSHFTSDPTWAKNFGAKMIETTLPKGAKIKMLSPEDFQTAFKAGITNESGLWNNLFNKGYDALLGSDAMNSKIVDYILNPKLLGSKSSAIQQFVR